MFPAAHVYVATKACRTGEPLFVVGSILPDITVRKILSQDDTHVGTPKFRRYLMKQDPSYQLLAVGMMTHGIDPKGVDYLAEVEYEGGIGYAFKNSKALVPPVAKTCILTGQNAELAAHNFIEMAVDYSLLKARPEIQRLIRDSLKAVDRDKIARHLSRFYSKDETEVRSAVNEYFDIISSSQFNSKRGLVKAEAWILKNVFKSDIDIDSSVDVLERAITIATPTYQQFLTNAVNAVRHIDFKIQ